jgi:hypothetical protein
MSMRFLDELRRRKVLTFMCGSEGRPEYLYRNMVAYRKTSSLEQPQGSNR